MSRKRMTTLPFLLSALSPFVIFESDYALILCSLCKSNTLWNRTRRCVTYKNDNFFFYFWRSPLLDFLSLLCNTNTLRNILMILGTNVEQDEMM